MRVVTDQVPAIGRGRGNLGVGLCPPALDEECGARFGPGQGAQDGERAIAVIRPVRMLGVEGEGDAKRGYFSTPVPVRTIPRVNQRWKMMKRITGISSVISVPAWINAGFV